MTIVAILIALASQTPFAAANYGKVNKKPLGMDVDDV